MAIATRAAKPTWTADRDRRARAGALSGPVGRPSADPRAEPHAWAFLAVAAAMVVAGGLVAAINSAAPFAHGSWLAAYLVLVGGVSQALLGVGCLALPAPRLSPWLRRAQLGLWNAGNAAVAAGVLAAALALVLAGSIVLLAALGCFAVGAGPARPRGRGRVLLYRVAVLGLAASVVVGSLLAGGPGGS